MDIEKRQHGQKRHMRRAERRMREVRHEGGAEEDEEDGEHGDGEQGGEREGEERGLWCQLGALGWGIFEDGKGRGVRSGSRSRQRAI